MKKTAVLVYLVSAILFSVLIVQLFYSFYVVKRVVLYNADVTVGDYIGITTENDGLHFGTLDRGGYSMRRLIISSIDEESSKVVIKVDGNISEFIGVSENGFILLPYETKTLFFTSLVPDSALPGNYTGTVKIYFKRQGILS